MSGKNIYDKLLIIQTKLKAPKSQYNNFGKYNYRNCEDILEALKPLLTETKTVLTLSDSIEFIGDRFYVKSIAILRDTEIDTYIGAEAYAREEENKKGMDGSQITGSSSSYARKYALNGLFAIDDTKDSDTTNNNEEKIESKTISESQAKRLYAIGKGNTGVIKSICMKYGYSSSKDIDRDKYESICNEIELEANKA